MRRGPQPIIWPWLTEAIIIGGLILLGAVVVLLMVALTIETLIIKSDERKARREKGTQP